MDDQPNTDQTEDQNGADGQQNADNQAPDGGSGTAGVDELTQLLGEVKPQQDQTPEQTETDLEARMSANEAELRQLRGEQAEAATETAIGGVVDGIVTDHEHLVGVDKGLIEGALRLAAHNDPRIGTAFANRAGDPNAWSKIEKALGREIAGKFQTPDPTITANKQAAREAAQGISTTGSSDSDDNGLSSAEIAKQFENGTGWDLLEKETGFRRNL